MFLAGQGSSVLSGKVVPLTALICIMGTIGSTVTALIWERNNSKAWKVRPYTTVLASLYGVSLSII